MSTGRPRRWRGFLWRKAFKALRECKGIETALSTETRRGTCMASAGSRFSLLSNDVYLRKRIETA
jgi:hypothetical protein